MVVHLHAIEVLTHLVKEDCENYLNAQNGEVFVEYHKPGAALAAAVNNVLMNTDVNVIFLKNHGVVIGGESIEEVDTILHSILERVKSDVTKPMRVAKPEDRIELPAGLQYVPIENELLHQLAVNPIYFEQLENNWVLYPDHVVFLGIKAATYRDMEEFQSNFGKQGKGDFPVFIFIKSVGVFALKDASRAQCAQLRCYYDIISRIPKHCSLKTLSEENISELLNWDAEQYRMNLAK